MSFLHKSIVVSGGQIVGNVLNMLAGILFARTLAPSGIGQFELLRSTSLIVVTIVALGTGGYANIYFLNNLKVQPVRVVTNDFKVSLVLGVISAVVLSALPFCLPSYFGYVNLLAAVWFGVGSGCLLITASLRPVLAAQLAAKRMVVTDLSTRVTILALGVFLLTCGRLKLETALIIVALGNVIACLVSVWYLRPHINMKLPFDPKFFLYVLKYSLKLSAANLLLVLSSSITVVLLRYLVRDFDTVGLYTRAVAISGMITLVSSAIAPLFYAKWAGLNGKDLARQGEMAMRMNFAFGVVACVFVLCFKKLLIRLLYGEAFMGATHALEILAPAVVLVTVFSVCNQMLAGDGRAMVTVYILLATLIATLVACWLIIPLLGIRGAALAVLLGNFVTAITSMITCSKLYGLKIHRCIIVGSEDIRFMLKSLSRKSFVQMMPDRIRVQR